jgi:hypothetical protein
MTQDEIIEMARQAGFTLPEGETWYEAFPQCIEDFAKLVAAKATDEANARSNTSWTLMCKKMVEDEREACHALRQTLPNPYTHCQVSAHSYDMACVEYGRAIRARGEA